VLLADNFDTALKKSIDYQRHIKPALEKVLMGGLITVEGNTLDETAKLLDTLGGIDLWMVDKSRGIRGVASRIQYEKNWRTFTIRAERESGAKTEYEKRKYAIDNDYLYPVVTYQAYIDCGTISIGVAYTKDLIDFIDKGLAYTKHTKDDQDGQASFWVIKWDKFKNGGYKFIEINTPISMAS
jgi:hypothetical protein